MGFYAVEVLEELVCGTLIVDYKVLVFKDVALAVRDFFLSFIFLGNFIFDIF